MKTLHLAFAAILAWTMMASGAEPAKEQTASENLAAARKQLLGTIAPTLPGAFEEKTNPAGEYVYEATSAQPIVEGETCVLESDKIVKGLTLVKMDGLVGRMPDELRNGGVYWKLGKINPEKYWIGVWYQSGDANNESSQGWFAPVQVYLNGRMVQLGTHGDPVQVAPGVYFAEAYTSESVELRAGDEIAVGRSRSGAVARVILTKQAPELGPYRIATNFGGHQWNPYTALGVNVDAIFQTPDGKAVPYKDGGTSHERRAPDRAAVLDADGNAKVDFVFSNPLPIPVKIKYDCEVRSYYYAIAAKEAGEMTIAPHGRVVKALKYKWNEGEPAYLAFANLRAVNPPSISESRDKGGLSWPEHEVYSYFKGQRHALPWPDPYAFRQLRRLTLAKTDLGRHEVLSLDGAPTWQRALTTDLEPPISPPANLEFKKVNVPYHEDITKTDPRSHGAYLRCSFTLPDNLAGRSYRLVLNRVQDEATAYVNGQKVGNVRGGNTPLYCDITSAVKPGSNGLIVVVRDLIAIMDPAYVDKNNPVGNASYLDAPGLFGRDVLAIFGAAIESGPAVSAEEIFVVPSVRKKTLAARLSLGNRTEKPVKVLVKATVLDEGKAILTVGEKEVDIEPGKSLELTLEAPWGNPRLWGPADPHLYALAVEVKDAATGKILDSQRDRFGFRESWIDGPHIMFNGYPIRPKGAPRITRLDPDGDFRYSRASWGDWSDETGMLGGCSMTELRNNMSQHNAESEIFWETAEKNAIVAMKSWRNHPSVQAWDLSNEWLCFAAPLVNDIMVPARHFKHLSDAVRAADPSRFTFFNGDEDLRGLLDNFSFHYMSPYWDNKGFGMRGHSEYFPDGEFWRPLNRHFKPGEEVPFNPFHADVILCRDKKVIMDNEYLWKCGDVFMPPGPTQWVGEDDVLSPAVDGASGPIAWMWKTKLDGHRDLGVAPINIYAYHSGVQRGAYLEQTFIIPENQRRAFSGRTETRRYTLLNGKFRAEDLVLGWKLKAPDGKTAQEGEFKHTMPSGGHACGEISFKVPDVSEPTTYTLSAKLVAGDRFISSEEWDVEVFPDKPVLAGKLKREVVLFDPAGNTAKALEQAGVKFNKVDNPGIPPGTAGAILFVIGEDSLDDKNAPHTAKLADFVEKGGRVLVLRQNLAPENLPVITKLEPRQWASQVFIRMAEHPVMQGLDSLDFHFWQPDRSVAVGAYTKPYSGNFVVLADSGGPAGMEQANLLELYRGEGSYVLCQIPAAGRYDAEPMARQLLARLVRYMGGASAFANPVGKIAVIPADNSVFLTRLTDMDVKHEVVKPGTAWDGNLPLMLEASAARKATPEQRADWTAKLNAGGRIILVNAAPEDQEWITQMAGSKTLINAPPYRMWEGRGFRRGWPRWTAGLSQLDLYWKRFDGGELAGSQAEDPSNMIEPLQAYSVKIQNGKELVFPGALTEVNVGKGLLLVDQRRWWTNIQALSTQAFRNISALLTALDVRIAPVVPPRPLPANIAYRTVDITPFANRGLADEVAEDGKGGFSDQGPRCDMRMFPTGPQLFQGVPFMIGREPKVCIVLASLNRPGYDSMPKEVGIPIGYPVEGLFFLHTTCWAGAPTAIYTIEYDDGQTVEIPLMSGENIHDWAGPRPFLREKGTQSVIAWTGKNDVFKFVGIFRMLWVNPRPDVPIKRVRFWGPNKNVPVQLGITAAVNGDVKVSNADKALAKQLLKDALVADSANKADDALRLLKDAVSKDPTLADAYRAMLDIAGKNHDDEKILGAAWAWGISPCRAAMPWNRIGEILEKRGDRRGALEAYVKSLEIEWNQPPIMDARRRLEAEAK